MSEQDKDGENKSMKIEFAEGCFDDFEGTQEELDAIVAQLTAAAESGSLLEDAVSVDWLEEVDSDVIDLLPMLNSNTKH
jgi:hypothetical protein